jgi:hypothetical protein
VGEQSNAYRILLRYDRKSRHRRIKKQRRYERLAATSQFRSTSAGISPAFVASQLAQPVDNSPFPVGVARTLSSQSPHLSERWTGRPYKKVADSAADCPYPADCNHRIERHSTRGTAGLTGVPRIQVCCRPVQCNYGRATRLPEQPGTKEFNPCGNFSGTSSLKFRGTKGSIGHTFMVCIHTENQNQGDFYPFVLLEISVLHESPLGHLRYGLTDVPPQPNSPPDNVFIPDRPAKDLNARSWAVTPSSALLNK